MRFVSKAALLAVILVSMTGCVSAPPHVSLVEPAERITQPTPGKALVYFIRSSKLGWPFPSPIFDGDQHIGTLVLGWDTQKNTQLKAYMAYEATPGKHMFSVYSENADFLPAELAAGKTYYVFVRVVPGVWKARFYLSPQKGQLPQHELDEVINSGRQVKLTAEGVQFVKDNAKGFKKVKEEWWQKYQARPASERPELRPEDGR